MYRRFWQDGKEEGELESEVILCTLGTRGDIDPFVALAGSLVRAGRRVALLANENWRDLVEPTGAAFHSIAPPDLPQSNRDDYKFFQDNTLPSFGNSFEFVERKVARGETPTLVYRVNMLGMQCAAQRFGLLNARVALQPCVIKSTQRPPWPLTIATQGPFGWFGRRVLLPALYAAGEMTSRYRGPSNDFRRSVGVAPARIGRRSSPTEDFVLMMCPEWFAMPQSDWPPNVYMVGFPFSDGPGADPGLEEFIACKGAPIVFTPGTGVTDTAGFFGRASEAISVLDRPGIFLSRHIPEEHVGNPRIACRPFADLAWLLPKAQAFVHHGGIGSTAQAVRAGIPQMVIPDRFDQPDNALRVATLGLGSAVLSDRRSGAEWGSLLLRTLASDHVRAQTRKARGLIERENAAESSARIVEWHIRKRNRAPAQALPGPTKLRAYEAA